MSPLLTLPAELIEAVLVSSRSPRTVANLAQTCRALHTLVYASPDTHLWRELFLATWDDPRGAMAHRAEIDPRVVISLRMHNRRQRTNAAAASSPGEQESMQESGEGVEERGEGDNSESENSDKQGDWNWSWDWGVEYRRRVAADRYLKAWRRDVCLAGDAISGGRAITTTTGGAATMTNDIAEAVQYTMTYSVLSVLLSTMLTLKPFPATPPIALTVLTPSVSSSYPHMTPVAGVAVRKEHLASAPPLPPLLILLASGFPAFRLSEGAARLGRIVYGPHVASMKTAGTQTLPIPTPSLPPQLVRTLLASHAVGVRGFPPHVPGLSGAEESGEDEIADLFHRIVCVTGFVPIPPPLDSVAASATGPMMGDEDDSQPSADLEDEDEEGNDLEYCENCGMNHNKSGNRPMQCFPKAFPTAKQQHADARTLARRRVYDMRYLRSDRLWGPYLSVTRASDALRRAARGPREGSGAGRTDEEEQGRRVVDQRDPASRHAGNVRRIGTLAWAMGMGNDPDEDSSDDDDEEDGEWQEPAGVGRASSSSTDAGDLDPELEPLETEPHPLIVHMLDLAEPDPAESTEVSTSSSSRRRTRRSNPRLPAAVPSREIRPEHLRPDYTYLASVRIVVEANLRELFDRGSSTDSVEDRLPEEMPDGVGLFWEDEDELLRARDGSPGVVPHTTLEATVPAENTTASHTVDPATTFDLVDILNRFKNLEVARLGGSCGYWSGWIERQKRVADREGTAFDLPQRGGYINARKPKIARHREALEHPTDNTSSTGNKGKGKGKEKESERDSTPFASPMPMLDSGLEDWEIGLEGEACEGWDWAGVEGIWRRCVCWMDYRELLFFNLDPSKFLTVDTQEACRIIPMEFCITGYTRAGLMPVHDLELERNTINILSHHKHRQSRWGYFRPPPVIHFSGSSIGSDRSPDDGRTVRGSVQLIGGGEVRWQMDTYAQGSLSSPEWSSEAIQIGGVGSALGVLGMWTGGGHERADPLGPFWAWKVA